MSSYIWCAGALLLLACSTLSNRRFGDCECGVHNNVLRKIANGVRANPNEFPWMVSIKFTGKHFCGGALINDRYVLTAGHCVQWIEPNALRVVLGQHSRFNKDGYIIPVTEKIVHEKFTSYHTHDDYDIALIKLERPITFSSKVSPICLPRPGASYDDFYATIIGWGAKSQTERDSNILKKAVVKVLTSDACRQTDMAQFVHDLVFCAHAPGIDACKGDSGGPITLEREPGKSEIIGVASFGKRCDAVTSPSIYTKVSKYVDWIQKQAQDGMWCRD